MWNKAKLAGLAAREMRGRKLVVVSNREPFTHTLQAGEVICSEPAGGLGTALKPVVAAVRGTWVAHASGDADMQVCDRAGRVAVPPANPSFVLRRIPVPAETFRRYYDGLANQALWPLCHNVYHRPTFRAADWAAYRQVNRMFADAALEEIGDNPAVVFVQDYHLALLPQMLKEARPDLTIAQFWHIPWPVADMARTFPWCAELIEGLLGNDVLGFHIDRYCENFLGTVEEACANARIDGAQRLVRSGSGETAVMPAPISIDFEGYSTLASSPEVRECMAAWQRRTGHSAKLLLSIDRLDYTKGILERLNALDLLLERFTSEWYGKVTLVQIGVPSRTSVPDYANLEREVDCRVAAINRRWGNEAWTPVILEKRNLGCAEMSALHQLADVCVVTPLHDGMNLVAKEFAASRVDGDGVLILSRFAGAAQELRAAVQVNPFSPELIADALVTALRMPRDERRIRMATLRDAVASHNIYGWAASILGRLSRTRTEVMCFPQQFERKEAVATA